VHKGDWMQVKIIPVLSSRAHPRGSGELGVAIQKKARKRLDCDVANAPRNDDCGGANVLVYQPIGVILNSFQDLCGAFNEMLKQVQHDTEERTDITKWLLQRHLKRCKTQ